MVIKKKTISKIKDIIKAHHNLLLISVLGKDGVSAAIIRQLKDANLDVSKFDSGESLLKLAYNHNLHNEDGNHRVPKTVEEAQKQQSSGTHTGDAHTSAIEHLDANVEQLVEKQAFDVLSRVEGIVRDNNNAYRFDALQNLNRTEALDTVIKKNSVGKLKQELRNSSKDAARNWSRIAATEVSNAVGIGSIDRIVIDNRHKNSGEVYVYRVNPNDAATCLAESEKVILQNGTLKAAGDLQIGDILRSARRKSSLNIPGEPNTISYVNKIQKEVFEYELEDGRILQCTEDHPVLIKVKWNRGKTSSEYLLFFEIGKLEDSLIPYEIVEYEKLTVGERSQIQKTPSWVKALGYADLLYFWKLERETIINMYLKSGSQLELAKELGLEYTTGFKRLIGILLSLEGLSSKNTKVKKLENNKYNQNYTNLKTKSLQKVLKASEKIILKEGKTRSFKQLARDIKVSHKALLKYVRRDLENSFVEDCIRASRRRAGIYANEVIDRTPGLRAKLSEISRQRLLNTKGLASKPQTLFFEELKKHFSEAELEVPILNSFRVDILIGNVIIEYDGSGHSMMTTNKKQKDYVRDLLCKKAGYRVIRIKAPTDKQPDMDLVIKAIYNKEQDFIEVFTND